MTLQTQKGKPMKKRILALCIAFAAAFSLLLGLSVPARAADQVDEIAVDYARAVDARQGEVSFTMAPGDVDAMLDRLFSEYPVLYHYYDGCQWTTYQDRVEVTLRLRNTEHDMDDIWVIGSDEELAAVLGIGLAEIRDNIHFVTRSGYIVSGDQVQEALEWLHLNYYLAYMGYGSWSSSYYERETIRMQDYVINFGYRYDLDAGTLQQWRNETEQVAIYLATNLFAQDMPDYLKVLKIHDWVVENCRYNTADLSEAGNHLAYGAMVKGTCVCMGYAEAGVLLFRAAGIEFRYVTGTGTNSSGKPEDHAWNAVRIDGDWYLLDMTWDDPVTSDGTDILRYDYFLLTDSQLAADHDWDRAGLPFCSGGYWNADRALEAAAQDTGVYQQYNTSRLATQADAMADYLSILQGAPPIIIPSETQPLPTQAPEPDDQPGNQPLPTQAPEAPEPPETQPVTVKPTRPKGNISLGTILIITVITVILIAVIAAAAILISREQSRRREEQMRRMYRNRRFRDL